MVMTDEERRQSLEAWETVDRSPITEDERKYLCANLRADAAALTPRFARHNITAAEEIERLVRELAEANRELEGWRHGNDYDPTPDGLGSGLQPRG